MANLALHKFTGYALAQGRAFTFESLGKAVHDLNVYSSVIKADMNETFPKIVDEVGVKSVYKLKPEMLVEKKSCTKDKMGKWLIDTCKTLNLANELLKLAKSTISSLQSTAIEDKETIIKLKEEVISLKNEELDSVSTTVQS